MEKAYTKEEISLIKSKIEKGYSSLAKTYAPFFMALLLAYFYAKPKSIDRVITTTQYESIYLIVFIFFLTVFIFFVLNDYKKRIKPFNKELKEGNKVVVEFKARKYFEPFRKNYLLFHPTISNKYLLINEQAFNSIEDGESIELILGSVTGVVLALRIKEIIISSVEKFSI